MELRAYQYDFISATYRAWASGHRRVLGVMPTGAGKTFTAAHMARDAVVKRQRRGVFLTHRVNLLEQTSKAWSAWGIPHGLLVDGEVHRGDAPFHIISAATARRIGMPPLGKGDLLIADEVQRGDSDGLMGMFKDAFVLGLSGSPVDSENRPLGALFDRMVMGPTPAMLNEQGYLAKPRFYAPAISEDGILEYLSKPYMTGGYMQVLPQLPRRQRVVFCTDINDVETKLEEFTKAGMRAVAIHSQKTKAQNMAAMDQIHSGAADWLINASMLVEGWDLPSLGGVVFLRLSKSLAFFLQAIGRGARMAPGKTEFDVHDFGGNVFVHGHPYADRTWTLGEAREAKGPKKEPASVWRCMSCFAVDETTHRVCPYCHTEVPPRRVKYTAGQLVEWDEDELREATTRKKQAEAEQEQRGKWHRTLTAVMARSLRIPYGQAGARAKRLLDGWDPSKEPFQELLKRAAKGKPTTHGFQF